MNYYIGLDVSMKTTFICVLNKEGQICHEAQVDTDPTSIADHLDKQNIKNALIGFESGSLTHYLMTGFKEKGLLAVCMDARKLKAILSIKINKTDKNDARGIAEALRCKLFTSVHSKPMSSLEKTMLLSTRKTLVEQQVQLKNTVRGLLKTFGIRLNSIGNKKFASTVKELLQDKPALCVTGIITLLDVFEKILGEIEKLDQEVRRQAHQDKQVQRLMTIPGVGPITALAYKAEIFDASRFHKSKAVGAYLGLTPTQYSSGEIQKQGRVSKCGSGQLRTLLVEAAIVLLTRSQKWSKLKAWGLKLMRKKGLKKAALAVARKLAVIMHQMMIQETEFVYGEQKVKTA